MFKNRILMNITKLIKNKTMEVIYLNKMYLHHHMLSTDSEAEQYF